MDHFVRIFLYIFISLALLGVSDCEENKDKPLSVKLGVQHGTGDLVGDALKAWEQGFKHITLWASPNSITYNYPDTDFGNVKTVTELVKSKPFRDVFEIGFESISLTAYSFSTFSWLGTKSEEFTEDQHQKELEEFSELISYLSKTYPNKKIFVKNWEGDWHLLAGYDPKAKITEPRLQAIRAFFQARSDGFYLGKKERGSIYFGIEFNLPSRARTNLRSLLSGVIPFIKADFVGYSAWESINAPIESLEKTILEDISFIRSFSKLPIHITEYGYSDFSVSARRTEIAVKSFEKANIPHADYWEMTGDPWGLIKPDGSLNPALGVLKRLMSKSGTKK